MRTLLISLLLAVVALLLASILIPLGLLVSFWKAWRTRSITKFTNKLSATGYAFALAIDIAGNIVGADLWNLIFIKNSLDDEQILTYHPFGIRGETMSSVLGKNKQRETLSKTGILLANFLDYLDHNHVEKSIQLQYVYSPGN